MIWELIDLRTQVVGTRVSPSAISSRMFILEGMLLGVMKSLLRTRAKASSALRVRGRVKFRKREEGTTGFVFAKLNWVTSMGKSWATEVIRILVFSSMV